MFQLKNTPIPAKAIPVARESLGVSDAMNGQPDMTQPNAGMFNSDDGGAFSKVTANQQPTENMFLALQNETQNMITGASQAAAAAAGNVRKGVTEAQQAPYRAQALMNETAAKVLEERGGGAALMQMNAIMQSPDRQAFVNDIATSRAMFSGEAPELGAYMAQANQYAA